MYDYQTPEGYGDSFFIYNFNGEDIPLANGNDYTLVGVPIEDGMFVCRVWSGGALIVNVTTGTVQMYDGVKNAWFLYQPLLVGSMFPPGMAVTPEKVYRDNSAFRFDLANVALNVNSNGTASVYADQMAWYGVKRVLGGPSDPLKSQYNYYEKPFSYPFTFSLTNYGPSDPITGDPIPGLAAPTQYSQLVQDFDFELRRITVAGAGGGTRAELLVVVDGEVLIFKLTAVTPGVAGNSITFAITVSGNNTPFACSVIGSAISVTAATNSLGVSQDIASLITDLQAVPAFNALVTIGPPFGDLSPLGTFTTYPPTPLTGGTGGGGLVAYASPFKILLYDATWRQRSTIPLLSELLCYSQNTATPKSSMPNNNWPSPPLMYPVNSVIRFDIFSLIPTGDALPVSMSLLFEGVRRIAC